MIRILHVVSVMDVGGMESFIMNLYREIDRNAIQFDFLVHHGRRGAFEDEIESLGGHVYHTTVLDDGDLVSYVCRLRELFRAHPEYRIVHGHLGSMAPWYLGEAERAGVPWRILHSHCPARIRTLKGNIKHVLFFFSPRHANIRFACSETAGRYQFRKQDFEIIPNGIDVRRFLFNEEKRNSLRARSGLEGHFVVGQVGRFYYEKNQMFTLKAFSLLLKKQPNAVLLLLGDGSLRQQAERFAAQLHIEDKVRFMGLQRDPAPFYMAMDAFVMPSAYEALPLAGIEAQCAGLPCLFSEGVSRETDLGCKCSFLPISENAEELWAETLLSVSEQATDRTKYSNRVWEYDMHGIAGEMEQRYLRLLEETP